MGRDHRVDRALTQIGDLGVGERVIGRAEPQRDGDAAAPGTERLRLEHVERTHVLEEVADGARAACATMAAAGTVSGTVKARSIDDAGKRDSAANWRSRRGAATRVSSTTSNATTGRSRPSAFDDRVGHLADRAHVDTAGERPGAATRPETGDVGRLERELLDLQRVDDRAEGVDRVVDVDRAVVLHRPAAHRARHRHREVLRFLRQRSRAGRRA